MQQSALTTLLLMCVGKVAGKGCSRYRRVLLKTPELKLRVWTVDISEREVLVREPMQTQADTPET